jgi:hypothetical protein
MTTTLRHADLAHLIRTALELKGTMQDRFGTLRPEQLNWKPNSEEWSIGQCLEHVHIATNAYITPIQHVVDGVQRKPTLWQRLPFLPSIFGRLLTTEVRPETSARVQAPKAFHPTQSQVDSTIVQQLLVQQDRLIRLMQASQSLPVERIIISSPAAAFVTYSVLNAFRIILTHEQHHLEQIRTAQEAVGFPI